MTAFVDFAVQQSTTWRHQQNSADCCWRRSQSRDVRRSLISITHYLGWHCLNSVRAFTQEN